MIVTVGRIGRAHGVRGEVTVEVRTDAAEERFAEGASLHTEPADVGPLTVRHMRWHSGRLLLSFDTVSGRDAAEALRGTVLLADVAVDERPDDPDEFHDHQLVGLRVVTVDGADIGTVREMIHTPAQDLVAVERGGHGGKSEALVPFVAEFVPQVDLEAGRLVIDPPPGLLDLDDTTASAASESDVEPGG